ncbi:flagellar brake protein [Allohahella marinimesophila]|uniref:C-di-GMP-binding flagellar brake protein YcgR n=1 Tax=Allohahella marinimesophila TaxID=1054972 RepID=A0ABP7NMD6_9GAMM
MAQQEKPSQYQGKDVEIDFDQLGLAIGDPLFLESADQQSRYPTRLVGFSKGQSILIKMPVADGRQIILKKDQPFTVRSAARNKVCAFKSRIIEAHLYPFAYAHLAWPEELLALEVRNAQRLKIELPTDITPAEDGVVEGWPKTGIVCDLSRTGAGLKSRVSIGYPDDRIRTSFNLSVSGISKKFRISCIIRQRQVMNDPDDVNRYLYGLQFVELSDAAKIMLTGFIYEQQDLAAGHS